MENLFNFKVPLDNFNHVVGTVPSEWISIAAAMVFLCNNEECLNSGLNQDQTMRPCALLILYLVNVYHTGLR